MAQAARLNLRMQKELKLLLTDPPPGASFPTLSDQHHGAGAAEFSLTSIDALLQGPEDTVYSNGLFKIKIQIPERYPFQPPIVTFATPIYHPNIDNGGRICLDILNLPPKGMWQPSLNISTVLTSIGLLLSEPNPDDGLMHEASRDYKYNRQAFDQHARSMTEKYAKAGVTDTASGGNGSQTHTNQSTSQVSLLYCSPSPQTKMEGPVASICTSKHRKLSLESQGCNNNERDSGEETPKVPIHNSSTNHIEVGPLKEASKDPPKYTGKLTSGRFKLLPKVAFASHKTNGESGNSNMSNQCSLVLDIQTTSDSPAPLLVQAGNISSIRDEGHVERSHIISVGKRLQSLHHVGTGLSSHSVENSQSIPQCTIPHRDPVRPQNVSSWSHGISHTKADPPKDAIARKGYCSTSIKLKKRGLVGVMSSSETSGHPQNHLIDDKENLAPYRCLFPQPTEQAAVTAINSAVIPESGLRCNETETKAVIDAPKLSESAVRLPLNQLQGSNKVNMHPETLSTDDVEVGKKQHTVKVCGRKSALEEVPAEAVIVLDSEDSGDENVPVRSKLCLAKRGLSRKRKSGIR